MNNFIQRAPLLVLAAASMLLASCGGGGGSNSPSSDPVPWNVAIPAAPLTAQQQTALADGLSLVRAGDSSRAIAALTELRAGVAGINPDVEAALGLGYAARANMGLDDYRAAANPRTFRDTKGTWTLPAEDVALYDLTTYAPGVAGDLVIKDGNVALQMLVPLGGSPRSLPEAQQAEIGMIATVQFLRVVSRVMGTNSRITSDSTIDSRVSSSYD
ncbi:MAG: hypothetical protein EOO21_00490, partial [Comamonadaceae bacterium]